MLRAIQQPGMRVSTFSDNIVISAEATETTITSILRGVAVIQLLALSGGHLVRGGVAVGELIHDDEVVFGPALNRAYYLESEVADCPRIVVDRAVVEVSKLEKDFYAEEDGVTFLDPVKPSIVAHWLRNAAKGERHRAFTNAGVPSSDRDMSGRARGHRTQGIIRSPQIETEGTA
jgi:hypothetical protein